MSPAALGFLRALGVAIIMAVVTFLADAANLHGIVPDSLGIVIAAVALGIEHSMAAGTTTALFGAVSTRRMQ